MKASPEGLILLFDGFFISFLYVEQCFTSAISACYAIGKIVVGITGDP
jgi:hypothetical protein